MNATPLEAAAIAEPDVVILFAPARESILYTSTGRAWE